MTCRKVRKALPLLAGGDLPAGKEQKLLAHVGGCALCREELEEYRSALGRVRAAARAEGAGDWSEADWKTFMARVTEAQPEKRRMPFGVRPRWALASGFAALLVLAVLAIRVADNGAGPGGAAPARGTDVLSVTMVSRETGLKVVWFFNKNFDWKGDSQ
jgi:hypothetical protein